MVGDVLQRLLSFCRGRTQDEPVPDSELLEKQPDKIRDMFAEVAPWYDFLNHLLSLGIDRRWRKKAAELAPQPLVGPVLDVCCGTGDLAFAYWRSGQKSIEVVGVDFCLPMLRLAGKKSRQKGGDRWFSWVLADAQALPFRDDTFQVVSVAFGIRNVFRPMEALREMVRVCRPGGQVVVLEFSLPSRGWIRRVYLWYFHRVLPCVGNLLSGNRLNAYGYLPASVAEFDQGEKFLEKMASAGLDRLSFLPLSWGIATLYLGFKP
jgi:demethylmenaquinone methyltransferase/2-methoxy-6-polyprenyl-1,4-benzoquinol methylase